MTAVPRPINLRRSPKSRRAVAKLLRCERCHCPLVETECGWLACYWLCDKLKSKADMAQRLIDAGIAKNEKWAISIIDEWIKRTTNADE
jgi:hypothetical protein